MQKKWVVQLPDGEELVFDKKPSIDTSKTVTITVNGKDYEYEDCDEDDYEINEVVFLPSLEITEDITFKEIEGNWYFVNIETNQKIKMHGITKFSGYATSQLGSNLFLSDGNDPLLHSEAIAYINQNQI